MKVIISESQYNFLKESILLESKNDFITYTTKYDQKLFRWDDRWNGMNYTVWQNVPAGTKFKFVKNLNNGHIEAWNGSLRFLCSSGLFHGRGYVFKDEVLTKALKNKFCNGKDYKEEIINLSYSKDVESNLNKIKDQSCINKIKSPYQNAINWWKNKLNEPAFYSKLKKINNYTDKQTKDWIGKYKEYLSNNVSGPFCPTKDSKWYKENFGKSPNTIAWMEGGVGGNRVVYNILYQNESAKDIEATLVHEIQHALYDLKPMTPHENWKKVFPYKVWVDGPNSNSNTPISNAENSNIYKYGLEKSNIDWWKQRLLSKHKDAGYVCRDTELASRVVTIKKLLNYKTDQKITVNDFKKFIEYQQYPYDDENVYWLVLCWVNNGMEDIQTFLDNLDKYVVAKVEPKKGDDMKDQIT